MSMQMDKKNYEEIIQDYIKLVDYKLADGLDKKHIVQILKHSIKTEYSDNKMRKDKGEQPSLEAFVFGKVQPQARELEEAILGVAMLEREAFALISGILKPNMFYISTHVQIMEAMQKLNDKGVVIDILTVTTELRAMGVLEDLGGAFYVSELTNKVARGANTEYNCRIIQQKFIAREVIRLSSEAIKDAYEETRDVHDTLTNVEAGAALLQAGIYGDEKSEIDGFVSQAMAWMKKSREKKGMSGVPTGMEVLDAAWGGMTPGELICVAARPGIGKTAFALTCARNQAMRFGLPVGIASLEMEGRELVIRLTSAVAEVNGERIKRGLTDDEQAYKLNRAALAVSTSKIYINDASDLTARRIRNWAKRMKAKHDIQVLYVDYLQIFDEEDPRKPREQQVSANSRGMKKLAKELGIPVVILAQLGRATEQNEGSVPKLSDLRESGAIEQDCDVVILLYRPEAHGYGKDKEGTSLKGLCRAICAKNRNGKTFVVNLKFVSELSNFITWEYEAKPKDENKDTSGGNGEKRPKRKRGNSDTWEDVVSAKGGDDDEVPF